MSDVLWAVSLLAFAAAVFRAELALLAGTVALQALVAGHVQLTDLAGAGVMAGVCSAALSIGVDSYFWQREDMLWPEAASLYFNVVQGKSAEWGVRRFRSPSVRPSLQR